MGRARQVRVELYSQTFLDRLAVARLHGAGRGPGGAARPGSAFPADPERREVIAVPGRALPSLRKRARYPEVGLHPTAAKARGIANGDWVSIETPESRVRARARLNDDLDPRVVVAEHGWWQGCLELGETGYGPFGPTATINLLIGTAVRDPVSGTPSLRSYLCEIRPIAQEEKQDTAYATAPERSHT